MFGQLTKFSRLDHTESVNSIFRSDVIAGLSAEPKYVPCKYFYDERGSALFDAICHLDEYYLTRTELEIMNRFAPEIARVIGEGATLVEFGSGSSVKTRLLLDQLDSCVYIPVDISREQLRITARRISQRYPQIVVRPVCADFTKDFKLPLSEKEDSRRVIYFPGSTIGNFEHDDAAALLRQIAVLVGPTGGVVIGVDLQKDVSTIEAAYNDSRGITAQFNLNLLHRINRELDGDFNLSQFDHLAFYDEIYHRVDLRLVSRRDQTVEIGSAVFDFCQGEHMHTEYSHKYTVERFGQMAAEVGLQLQNCWTDSRQYFAVLFLTW